MNGETYNFSERHMEYNTSSSFYDGENSEALDRKVGDGGLSMTAFTYYSRGSGPILEEYMPFENNENDIGILNLPINVAAKKVDNMVYFPHVYKYKDDNNKIIYEDAESVKYEDIDVVAIRNKIKEHIINYGGVVTSFGWYETFFNYDNNAFYNYDPNMHPNHDVTIIGWDDNYSVENFNSEPVNKGAYIVLNSWGENWGENGIFYVSYDDVWIESQIKGVTAVSDIDYDKIYQHDISQMTSQLISKYSANVFTSLQDEILTEVMVGTLTDQTCNIYIGLDGQLNINNKEKVFKVAENELLKPGYNTIEINSDIEITKGTKFAVIIEFDSSSILGAGMEKKLTQFCNVKSNEGESFYSSNGQDWIDLYDANDLKNFSIKAYTQTKVKEFEVGELNGIAIENIGGSFKFTVNTSYIEDGNKVNLKIYKDEIDITDEFEIIGNTIVGKGAYISLNCPTNIQKGEYNIELTLSDYNIETKKFLVYDNTDEYVTICFEDFNFYKYMKDLISISVKNDANKELTIKKEELAKITELDLYNNDIEDISGIENFYNLENLSLELNPKIADFSPLTSLINLKDLNLAATTVTSLDFIEEMDKLESLNLTVALIKEKVNIEDIFKLNNLKYLFLSGSEWLTENDLINISNLNNLELLDVTDCNIKSLEFLKTLDLKYLYVGNEFFYINGQEILGKNDISDLSPISNMVDMKELIIRSNKKITTLDPLKDYTKLEVLQANNCSIEDASILDSENLKNAYSLKYYTNLQENSIIDDIQLGNEMESQVIEIPKIIQQACDENSLLYSSQGIQLNNCNWKEIGKSIEVDISKDKLVTIYVLSGCAQGTKYSLMVGNPINDMKIISLELKQLPDKIAYMKGEDIDLTGLKLSVEYENGFIDEIGPELVWNSGFNNQKTGCHNINVYYKDESVSFDIYVKENIMVLNNITLKVLEQFDLSNYALQIDPEMKNATYYIEDESVAKIENKVITALNKGKTKLTVSSTNSEYNNKYSIYITVKDDSNLGSEENPYLISTVEEFNNIREDFNGYYKLINDIDLSSIENFEPIGSMGDPFKGTFDGNGYEISGLNINAKIEDWDGIGLFSATQNAEIKNLGIVKSQINAENITGEDMIGGTVGTIVGRAESTVITNVYSDVDICGSIMSAIGGIVGNAYNTQITNSFNAGNILLKGNIPNFQVVGGIAGAVGGTETVIKECYNIGNLNSNINTVGGIVGEISDGLVQDVYNIGNIDAVCEAGGIIGKSYWGDINVKRVYNTGKIEVKPYVEHNLTVSGGIVGVVSNKINMSECYYSNEKIEANGSVAGNIEDSSIEKVAYKKIEELKSGILFEDSEDIWIYEKDKFPKLKNVKEYISLELKEDTYEIINYDDVNYITGIDVIGKENGILITDFKNNFNNFNAKVYDLDGNEVINETQCIVTGMKIVTIDNIEYIILVDGDINSDGVADATDAAKLLWYSIGKINDINENYYLIQMELNKDNIIDATDAAKMLWHNLGKISDLGWRE